MLTFTPANALTPQPVNVTAVEDAVAEGPHTSTITHAAASTDTNYNGLSINDVVANITDNDAAGVTITESGGTTDVTEGGAADSYTVVLDSVPDGERRRDGHAGQPDRSGRRRRDGHRAQLYTGQCVDPATGQRDGRR